MVVKVVTAETTTMGYKSLVTFSDIPSVAMIKENSQFVPMSFPIWIDCFGFAN
jgi:hypothetical protein